MTKIRLLCLAALVACAMLALPGAGLADKGEKRAWNSPRDFRFADDVVERGTLPVSSKTGARTLGIAPLSTFKTLAAGAPGSAGDKATWLGLDDALGEYYLKTFTLRAVGEHADVWVADSLDFPAGDCRNGERTTVTDSQVTYLLQQFDSNIYPKESATFSVAPDRDGSGELLSEIVGELPPEVPAVDPAGAGDHTVILVDNVRDGSFYDPDNSTGSSYIAGFFSSQLNQLFDRNVMTIDVFDWKHRTGASPPDDPVPGDFCTSAPARPFLYEGVFAHEYQHLLESYEDPDETNWINEGLADWAQTLTGYVNPKLPITDKGFDSHVQCFLGYLGVQTPANPNPDTDPSGPENSLTRWGDQGDAEILCDYGAAYTLMEFLAVRYGTDFMSSLHRGDENGLAGLQEALSALPGRAGSKTKAQDVLHDWSLMVALDGMIDRGARTAGRPRESQVTTPTLDASINWDVPGAYAGPGAPSNGADYVRLRRGNGTYLRGDQINSISFAGATTLPSLPLQWTVDANPPAQPGDPALASGAANDRDESIVRQVAVPAAPNASLSFDAFWNEEELWDYGFVQVSTDGGTTYESVACTDTTGEADPEALTTVRDNLPGYTGLSEGWMPQSCSLAAYAGQTVLLAFRAVNDPAVIGNGVDGVPPGFWVDDVKVGTTLVSDGSSLAGWRSVTETRPNPVAGFTVVLVSFREGDRALITVRQLRLTGDFNLRGKARIQRYIDRRADFVGAIVFYDDPSEASNQYAPYRLSVNGITQPGGGF